MYESAYHLFSRRVFTHRGEKCTVLFVYTADFISNILVVTPSLPGSCDQSESLDWSLGLLECAYVHEYVLSIAVSVRVPEAPASHSETESGTHTRYLVLPG